MSVLTSITHVLLGCLVRLILLVANVLHPIDNLAVRPRCKPYQVAPSRGSSRFLSELYSGLWHTLTEHWDGSAWSVVSAVDAGSSGNQFYAVKALASDDVYAVGQQAGTAFPNQALVEHWNGKSWSVVSSPTDASASALPLGVTATSSTLAFVGEQETDTAPYTTYVAAGSPGAETIQSTPNAGTGENDLFAATTAADGSTWAVGWDIDTTSGNHDPLILQGKNGAWSLVSSPNLGTGSDTGFAAIAAIPGGGMWAVGVTAPPKGGGNYSTLIEFHP